jgi:hypothetical protein
MCGSGQLQQVVAVRVQVARPCLEIRIGSARALHWQVLRLPQGSSRASWGLTHLPDRLHPREQLSRCGNQRLAVDGGLLISDAVIHLQQGRPRVTPQLNLAWRVPQRSCISSQ